MRIAVLVFSVALMSAANFAAADPITGLVDSFFHYREPAPPMSGDCASISAAIGPQNTWYGEFSGRYLGRFERYQSYSARGCFDSEIACRIWQHQALTYASGPVLYMTCRRGS